MVAKYKILAVFNMIMGLLLFASSEFVFWRLHFLGEAIDNIGFAIDTRWAGSAADIPPGRVEILPLLNYPLIFFIIMVIGNVILLLMTRKKT